MKTIIFALSIALVGMGVLLVSALRAPAAAASSTAAAPAVGRAAGEPAAPPPRSLPPTVDVRAQVARAIEQKAPELKNARDVDRYLDDLEAQARRNRKVTALEVEPGMQAIAQVRAELGPERARELEQAFSQKMARISAEYDGRDRSPATPALDEAAARIEHSANAADREAAIRRYSEAARSLPGDEQVRAFERLNQLARAPQ